MTHFPAVFRADSATAIQQRSRRCKDVVSYPMPHFEWRASANELRRQQIAQSRQVVRGEIEQRMRANLVQAARHQTAQRADILHPTEGFLDHLSTTQTDRIAFGGGNRLGDSGFPVPRIAGNVRCRLGCRQAADEVGGIKSLVAADGDGVLARHGVDHRQRRIGFRSARRLAGPTIDHEPITVLHEGVAGI